MVEDASAPPCETTGAAGAADTEFVFMAGQIVSSRTPEPSTERFWDPRQPGFGAECPAGSESAQRLREGGRGNADCSGDLHFSGACRTAEVPARGMMTTPLQSCGQEAAQGSHEPLHRVRLCACTEPKRFSSTSIHFSPECLTRFDLVNFKIG